MATAYRTEHVATVPRGYRVRTVKRAGHEVRIAFPPGRRMKGSGQVVEVLHPAHENSCRMPNPAELLVLAANPAELMVLGGNPNEESELSGEQLSRRGLEGASQMYEDFHGEPGKHVDTYQELQPRPMTLAQLGVLRMLEIKRPGGWKWAELNFIGKEIQVAANPTGTQIYFIGGDQKISRGQLTQIGSDNSKELIDLGECMLIDYRARKMHVNGVSTPYGHKFGDETGRRPRLMYDRRGPESRIYLVGGEYVAKIEGIRN